MDTMSASPDFKALHDRFRPRVLRYLSRVAGPGEAEDLTQSVMLKASQALPGFRGESSLSTWIYRIAANTALDHLRRKSPGSIVDLDALADEGELPPEAQTPSVEASASRGEMNACIREFVERLPANERTVMVLSELEGFANAEIASMLGLTLGNVKIRLHRARERLRQELEAGCSFDRRDGELACDRKPVPITFRPRR